MKRDYEVQPGVRHNCSDCHKFLECHDAITGKELACWSFEGKSDAMTKITAEQLDSALFDALHMPADTSHSRFQRVLSVSNLVNWYQREEMYYPPLNAVDSDIFHECCDEARRIGLLK